MIAAVASSFTPTASAAANGTVPVVAHRRNARMLLLMVTSNNEPAIRFYLAA